MSILIVTIYIVGVLVAIPVLWVQMDFPWMLQHSDGAIDAGTTAVVGGLLVLVAALIWPVMLAFGVVVIPIIWGIGTLIKGRS